MDKARNNRDWKDKKCTIMNTKKYIHKVKSKINHIIAIKFMARKPKYIRRALTYEGNTYDLEIYYLLSRLDPLINISSRILLRRWLRGEKYNKKVRAELWFLIKYHKYFISNYHNKLKRSKQKESKNV
jgi:hypothetical protein